MPMVPGRLARSDAGAAVPRLPVTALERGLDMSHRKSATAASAPNEHPSRVSPATPCRPQPRFFHASRPVLRSGLGVGDATGQQVRTVVRGPCDPESASRWEGDRAWRKVGLLLVLGLVGLLPELVVRLGDAAR